MSEALPTLLQSDIGLLIVAGVGALAGSALALLPGLHIYNVAGACSGCFCTIHVWCLSKWRSGFCSARWWVGWW